MATEVWEGGVEIDGVSRRVTIRATLDRLIFEWYDGAPFREHQAGAVLAEAFRRLLSRAAYADTMAKATSQRMVSLLGTADQDVVDHLVQLLRALIRAVIDGRVPAKLEKTIEGIGVQQMNSEQRSRMWRTLHAVEAMTAIAWLEELFAFVPCDECKEPRFRCDCIPF